jgi:hypothetical protein
MKKTNSLMFMSIFSFVAYIVTFAQKPAQTIKGTVLDKASQSSIIGATIVVLGIEPAKGTVTDIDGKFKLQDVPVGRYDVRVTFLGYKERIISNVQVTSGKEVTLDLNLEENITALNEIVISGTKKNETNNELNTVSGRSFSMEEVGRYAGGRGDPARLAANFAGVSATDDSRNDIVIRGNSPNGVLWRIEGLSMPNPNHFSGIGTTGGPLNALNNNILKNSDFFTSAFASEYGNANAGVFDLGFRNGNTEKREHSLQFGLLTGLEANSEGPLKKGSGASYVIAYRYAFTGFAQAIGLNIGTTATPFYQDLSFKINSGTTKVGRFTLFGLGGTSNIDLLHNKLDTNDLFADPTADAYFKSNIGLLGLKHFIKINTKSYINTVIGGTFNFNEFNQDSISKKEGKPIRVIEQNTNRATYSINSSFNSKISSRLFLKIGAIAELMNFDLNLRDRLFTPDWNQIWKNSNNTTLLQAYGQAKYSFTDKLNLNIGVHTQFLTLNNSYSIEPRVGLKYQVNNKNSLSIGYGLHSQMLGLNIYFYRKLKPDGTYDESNTKLDFTRSHHFVLGYDFLPAPDWRIKSEVYYQYLFNIPVSDSRKSYSLLNSGDGNTIFEFSDLKNTGTGSNYGLELTIEKFFSKGFYGLATGSLYDSKYKGSNGKEYNTAFNGKYVYNILVGKEFKIGKAKRNLFTLDLKVTQAGGRFFTPIDLDSSRIARQEIRKTDDASAFSERNPNYLRIDFKFGFTFNSKKHKLSQTVSLDLQNISNNQNVFAQRYNPVSKKINTAYQIGFFPNFTYKIQF